MTASSVPDPYESSLSAIAFDSLASSVVWSFWFFFFLLDFDEEDDFLLVVLVIVLFFVVTTLLLEYSFKDF